MKAYKDAYDNGYLCGEVARELGQDCAEGFDAMPWDSQGVNPHAWSEAQFIGYNQGLSGDDKWTERALDIYLDSNFCI